MRKSQPVVRAIDVGYGNTKFVRGIGRDGTPVFGMFPSLAPVSIDMGLNGGPMQRRDTVPITIDNVTYEVGPDARLLVNDMADHPNHEQYIDTPEYLALNRGALYYMDVDDIDLLVVGLPVSLLSHRSGDLANRLRGTHSLPGGREVRVHDVLVIAQPLGGFVYHSEHRTGRMKIKSNIRVIVDPGYVTLDWLTVKGFKVIESRSGAIAGGMRQVLQSIADGLTSDRRINPSGGRYRNLEKIDEGLRTGHFLYCGKPLDLGQYLPRSLAYVNKAVDAMRNSIVTAHDIDEVILVGGGAGFFRPVMKHIFPDQDVSLVTDAIYANVSGFLSIGQRVSKRGMAA